MISEFFGNPSIKPSTNVSIPPARGPRSFVTSKTFLSL